MGLIFDKLSNNQSITITLAGLASGSQQESAAVDNTTNQDIDASVMIKLKSGASGTSSTGSVVVYAKGSSDGGTTWSDTCTGSNAAVTLTSPPNVRPIGIINVVANATTYVGGPFSIAAAFGGILPGKWGIVVENDTGATLDSTAANFAVVYERVQGQYT